MIVALLIPLAGQPSVHAATPTAPTGLTPNASSEPVDGIPILTWNRVSGATTYSVEVSSNPGFDSLLWSTTTVNRRATPTVHLGAGMKWWRVRGSGASGTGSWATASFARTTIAGPTLTSPASGVELAQPHEPVLLQWNPVQGATGYTVEVGKDENFTDPILTKSYPTKTSALVVPDPQVANTYYWHVRAQFGSGVITEWSDTRNYRIGGLTKPVLTSPADSPETDVVDVVLDWEPVLGAKAYDVQVSTDVNFNTIEQSASPTDVTGTRYSPKVTLDNDQYYWRVRPVDANGNELDWSAVDTWRFRRHWPEQPVLEYPINGTTVSEPIFFQWTAVPHASDYRLELSRSSDFNTLFDSCTTTNTTFVPSTINDCFPTAGDGYWWRVVALDGSRMVDTESVFANSEQFTYDPQRPTPLSPADGASVEVPVLSWAPVAGATGYSVTIVGVTGSTYNKTFTTSATTFSMRDPLTVGATYRWQVRTLNNGRTGMGIIEGFEPTFTVAAATDTTTETPQPTAPADLSQSERFPNLRWTRVTGATRYKIWVRRQGDVGFVALQDLFPYAAAEDDTDLYHSPGTYEWFVQAFNGNSPLTSSDTRRFVISSLASASGHRLALRGTSLSTDASSCLNVLPAKCEDLRQTPVLRWTKQANAGYYNVYLARDAAMTNIIAGYPKRADTNHFTPTTSLIDSQAGQAFYWFVQPCKGGVAVNNTCRALAAAQHAFNKLSNPVQLISPANGATVADEVTLNWTDYLETNLQDLPSRRDFTGVSARVEARSYQVQVSTDPNFQTVLEQNVVVDQTTYTAFAATYPEGPLYWKVQALDGSLNPLTWSDVRTIQKVSAAPTLISPVGNQVITSTRPFRWQPLEYAGSYDIEVYKNADTTGSSENRVAAGTIKQTAFTLATPLPPSSTPYTWRVRRKDAKDRPGPWTDLSALSARFQVTALAPALVAPAHGALVPSKDALFQWQPVDGAATYSFEYRLVGGSTPQRQDTASLAWAPKVAIADGLWEWRVTAKDSAAGALGSSGWRPFKVDGTAPKVVSRAPTTTAYRTSNFVAKFSEPVMGVGTGMKLYLYGNATPRSARVTLSADRKTGTLNPSSNLIVGRYYTIKLSSGITDMNGNRLVATSWRVKAR